MALQRSRQRYCTVFLRGYVPRGSISNAACFFRVRPVTLARARVRRPFLLSDSEHDRGGYCGPGGSETVLDQQVDPKSKSQKLFEGQSRTSDQYKPLYRNSRYQRYMTILCRVGAWQ